MKLLESVAEFRRTRAEASGSLGLVPTMGYLHRGHMALVKRAREENDSVAVSIFINPTQFGPSEGYQTYPRDLRRDLELLKAEGVKLVFAPPPEEIYAPGFDTWVEVGALAERLEGASRPDHFRGVATVVMKLFNIVRPDRAYFGQKDAQQVRVIEKMVADLDLGLEVVAVPTVREPDGLAISSRNTHLSPEERKAATVLWSSLSAARDRWAQGEARARILKKVIVSTIEKEPLARLDYVSTADSKSLEEMDTIDRPTLVSLAVWIGKTRLIDNITLEGR
ncbi:MAG: pantoate--beta-alanine ligase [Chloroflexi bacterium]|nr:pantoate--beta-alanine ligase [Chloroflexota bacterium]